MTANPTTPIEMDYTDRDFDSIRTFLISAARGFMPEWQTVGEAADFGTLLIELYAYVGDILNYYIDRVAAEPFLASAVRRQSVLAIADMLGYVPVAQQAATGVVTFTITNDNAYVDNVLQIPSGTVLQTQASESAGAVFFETVGTALIGGTAGRTTMTGAQEGRTVAAETIAVSNGAPLQEYVLRYQGVIHRSLTLTVQESDSTTVNQVWTYVDNLADADPDASVYTTYIDDRQYTHVVFGDNVAGRIPPTGAVMTVSYRYGQGAVGNVVAGMITIVTPPLTDVAVNNATAFQGGADNESIDSMRHGIPRAAKLKDRAITLQDFADLAFQVPSVAKAVATGLFYTNVKLYIAPVGGGYPTPELLRQVEAYINDRALVGTTVEMHPQYTDPAVIDQTDPIYTYVVVQVTVHVLPQYGQLTVKNAVTDAITAVFSFDNPAIDFGAMISRGDVFHAAMNVTGVDWIDLTAMYPTDDNGNQIGSDLVQDVQASNIRIPLSDPAHITITAQGGLT